MTVIAFPGANDQLAFAGLGIKIDVGQQRKNWDTTFMSVQTAVRFCNFNHVEAEKTVRDILHADAGLLNVMGSGWADTIDYLESIIAIMKSAVARLEVSEARVSADGK